MFEVDIEGNITDHPGLVDDEAQQMYETHSPPPKLCTVTVVDITVLDSGSW